MLGTLRKENGQALVLVLAFMVLSVPLVTSTLTLTSTLLLDSRSKTEKLKEQYAALGTQAIILHNLVASPATGTSTTTINGLTITTTVFEIYPASTTAAVNPLGRLCDYEVRLSGYDHGELDGHLHDNGPEHQEYGLGP